MRREWNAYNIGETVSSLRRIPPHKGNKKVEPRVGLIAFLPGLSCADVVTFMSGSEWEPDCTSFIRQSDISTGTSLERPV